MKSLNEFLNQGRRERTTEYASGIVHQAAGPAIVCKDGYEVSVQASENTYCHPRVNYPDAALYSEFELGFPNMSDELIDAYAESVDTLDTVYPYIPRALVEALIKKHGGLV